jgi:hypothetical protein
MNVRNTSASIPKCELNEITDFFLTRHPSLLRYGTNWIECLGDYMNAESLKMIYNVDANEFKHIRRHLYFLHRFSKLAFVTGRTSASIVVLNVQV